jgi:hypothetical protein
VILAVWVASLGWLLKREYFRPTGARLAEAALAVAPGALFYHLDARGRQVGFASTTVDTLVDSVRVEDLLVLDAPALGAMQRTTIRSVAVLTRALRLRSVTAEVDGDGLRFAARGTVTDDTVFRLTLEAAGDSVVTRWPLPRPVVVPSLLPLRLAFGGELRRGNAYTARLFDPVLLAERDVTVRVGAESTFVVPDSADYDSTAMAWVPVRFDTVRAFVVDQEAGGHHARVWIDGQGRVVRTESPGGLVMQRAAFEIAYENFRRRDTARLVAASASPEPGAIVPRTALAAGVRPRDGAATFRARVSGVPLEHLGAGGPRTVRRGDTIEVRQEDLAALPRTMRPVTDPALAAFLGAAPLVATDDPRIAAQARQIVGRDRNARRAAELLVRWVHAQVRAAPASGLPGAVATLVSRRGDCNEQAALLVGLARAAGIPARTVAGLLYIGGRFYYHAWVEVYVGGWVAADPLTGEFPAGAARIGLVAGGFARHAELAPLVGQLALEVL